ncbi:MAG TPA: prolipoprotein diacylglyceryl transferase family protein [Kofleriaceae bacterium]|nr:prolipoprotein diacylglyceryl transferase family protein [Kofleriaceae bacterium]
MGALLSAVLAARVGMTFSSRVVLEAVPPLALLVSIKLSEIVAGQERLVAFEMAAFVVASTAVVAWLAGTPVVATIDVALVGVGAFLVFGRIGCFRVACCHGRCARRGVAYREEHAQRGFAWRLVGCRLIPTQLLDGAAAALATIAAFWVVWDGTYGNGTATGVLVVIYGVLRAGIELMRGDWDRPRVGGASEAQWSAFATTSLVAAIWPAWWTIGAAGVTGGLVLALVTMRLGRWVDRWWLASPWHAAEVAEKIEDLVARGDTVTTSEGLRLSAAAMPDGRVDLVISRDGGAPAPAVVASLASQLGRPWSRHEIVPGRSPDVVHLLLDTAPSVAARRT